MLRIAASIGLFVLASIAAGCECGSGIGLSVDLRSNLVPGIEIDRARTEVYLRGRRVAVALEDVPMQRGDPLARGVRILEVDGLGAGSYDVIVTVERDGVDVARRTINTTLRATTAITVLITRDCLSVSCPEMQSCRSGSCVPNECSEEHPEQCPTSICERDSDCTASAACAIAECAEGACFVYGDDSRCAPSEYCHPEQGCLPLPGEVTTDGGSVACADGEICDDGIYCNGVDTCAGGSCTVHPGDPCIGASTCNEATDRCEGCGGDADCPAAELGAWGGCTSGDACASTGTHTRGVTRYSCIAATCMPSVTSESEGCDLGSREGVECGGTVCGGFSGCSWAGTCAEIATQTRTCTEQRCRSGVCTAVDVTDARDCNRDTEGIDCGSGCDPYGGCDWASECAESATRSRTCYDRTCADGGCRTTTRTQHDDCARDTANNPCGSNPTYCGTTTNCHICIGGSCEVNSPHYDDACNPSCGVAASLCGSAEHSCCSSSATFCPTVGPSNDCAVCCATSFCY